MFLDTHEKLILVCVQRVRSMNVDAISFSVEAHHGTVADAKLDWKMCVHKWNWIGSCFYTKA